MYVCLAGGYHHVCVCVRTPREWITEFDMGGVHMGWIVQSVWIHTTHILCGCGATTGWGEVTYLDSSALQDGPAKGAESSGQRRGNCCCPSEDENLVGKAHHGTHSYMSYAL